MAPSILGNPLLIAATIKQQDKNEKLLLLNNNNNNENSHNNNKNNCNDNNNDNDIVAPNTVSLASKNRMSDQQETQAITTTTTTMTTASTPMKKSMFEGDIVWRNVIAFAYLHISCAYSIYLLFTATKFVTIIAVYLLTFLSGMGTTAGAHRLWAHKSYKARMPLRIVLMVLQTLSFQNSIYEWVRDHRVHHKYTDTNADPHNVSRGFFFSHMGWLMLKKHPDVKIKGRTIDMTDLEQDSVVMFQKRYYVPLMILCAFILPTCVPYFLLNESLSVSWYTAAIFRYVLTLHGTWLVNSAAHIWGMRPYDIQIKPTNNLFVSIISFGEGWHNYHHVFPWDYKTSELGNYGTNFTTGFLDFCGKIGLAYDMKTVSEDLIKKRQQRTGGQQAITNDSSETPVAHNDSTLIWGWDDQDLSPDEKKIAYVVHPEFEKSKHL